MFGVTKAAGLYFFEDEMCLTKSQGATKVRSERLSDSSKTSTQAGGGGRTGGKSRDIWAAASLPSKDSYCGLCFCFR